MSIFRDAWKGPEHGEFPIDRPIFTKTGSAATDEILALVQELASKKGVPVTKLTKSGRVVTKTLHVDSTSGLYLSYSPSPKQVLHAAVPLSFISEVRAGAEQHGFHKVTIMPERVASCFSLVFLDGKAWNLSFTTGNQVLWKNGLELLIRRAVKIESEYPLRCFMNRLWLNCAPTSVPDTSSSETAKKTDDGDDKG